MKELTTFLGLVLWRLSTAAFMPCLAEEVRFKPTELSLDPSASNAKAAQTGTRKNQVEQELLIG